MRILYFFQHQSVENGPPKEKNLMRNIKWLLFVTGVFLSSVALADLDPELAQVSSKNESGASLGFGLNAGQAYATGGSNPGIGF